MREFSLIVWTTLEIAGLQRSKVRYLPMKRDAITRPTVRRAGFQVCAWLMSQQCRIWKLWWWLDIVLRLSPAAAAAADDETGEPPPLPARVFLGFLPPGTGIGLDEVPTSPIARPLIDDLCPSNLIGYQESPSPSPPADLQPQHPSPPHPNHTPRRNIIKTVPSPLRRDLADIVVRPCLQFRFTLRGGPGQCLETLQPGGSCPLRPSRRRRGGFCCCRRR